MVLLDSATTNSMHSSLSLPNLESIQQGHQQIRSLLIVAATGLGKTCIMGGMANHWPVGRVMMISHRFELNMQAIKSFEHICQEDVHLEQADYHADRTSRPARIVVASVSTLNSRQRKLNRYRMEKFDPHSFGLLMIDEAHRAAAPGYRRVIQHFRQNPDLCVVGVTATPDRLDGIGLGCVFEEVACDYNIVWGIQNGWLVPPKQLTVNIKNLDLSGVRTLGGDLDEKQLAKIVEMESNLHEMAQPIVDICGTDKQAIVFTASVKQATRLAEVIRDYHARVHGNASMDTAVSIDGSMSPQDPRRRQLTEAFKRGEIQYLVNCGVATEGFDAPNVRVVAIARPTKSRALYIQMLGRGTRPIPGTIDNLHTAEERIAAINASSKPQCLVVDFVGQSGRHQLLCSTDILAGPGEPAEIIERARRIAASKDWKGDSLQAIQEAREQARLEREARRAKVTMGVDYQLVETTGALYDTSRFNKVFCPGYLMNKGPTEKQRAFLINLGYTASQIEGMNPRQASAAIDYAIKHPKNGYARRYAQWKAKQSGNS